MISVTVLGIAIPAGLILVGAKYVPMWIDDVQEKMNKLKNKKKADSSK